MLYTKSIAGNVPCDCFDITATVYRKVPAGSCCAFLFDKKDWGLRTLSFPFNAFRVIDGFARIQLMSIHISMNKNMLFKALF